MCRTLSDEQRQARIHVRKLCLRRPVSASSSSRYSYSPDRLLFLKKSPVYEYPIGDQWIMLDAEDGYVLWTAIWKGVLLFRSFHVQGEPLIAQNFIYAKALGNAKGG